MRVTIEALLATALALVACEQGDEPRRVEHRAVYAAELGVFELSIARLQDGGSMLFWTEGSLGRGSPTWMKVGDTQAHRISLPGGLDVVDRAFSPLLALDGGDGTFVAYGLDGMVLPPILHEIVIDPAGGLVSQRAEASTFRGWIGRTPDAFAFGSGQVALLGYDTGNFQSLFTSVTPGESLGLEELPLGLVSEPCAPQLVGASTPEGVGVVARTVCSEPSDRFVHETSVFVITAGPRGLEKVVGAGPVDPPGDLVDLAANESGVALLVSREGGRLAVFAVGQEGDLRPETPVDGLFESLAWELDVPATEARLFTTDRRFVVVWNEEEGESRRTRAITIEPGHEVGDAFDWPLPDEECPVRSAVAASERLEYTCSARCQGAGCAERWIYRGEIVLP